MRFSPFNRYVVIHLLTLLAFVAVATAAMVWLAAEPPRVVPWQVQP